MFYLFWTLLNCAIAILFFIVCYRAVRLVKEKMGAYVAIFFVIGLLSFSGRSNDDINKDPKTGMHRSWNFTDPEKMSVTRTGNKLVLLQNNLVCRYFLDVLYGKDSTTGELKAVSADSFTNGFVGSATWIPGGIVVNESNDRKSLDYYVSGTVQWKLYGMEIYSEPKIFKGTVKVL